MIDELLNKILTSRSRLLVATTATGVVVRLSHSESLDRPLYYGVGDTFEEALMALDKRLAGVRQGPHVGGE